MISIERVYNQLQKQVEFTSVVELAMMLEANTSEVRQRLNELGDRVTQNEKDEWKITSSLVRKLELSPLSASEIEERNELENTILRNRRKKRIRKHDTASILYSGYGTESTEG